MAVAEVMRRQAVAQVAQVVVFVLLPSLEHSQEELSKARAARYHPTFQMKKRGPREEIAL